MDWFHVLILALIQGITEFLPISSSAHLILPKELLGWPDQGLAFDVAVHCGSLCAVLLYFRKDLQYLIAQSAGAVFQRRLDDQSRLLFNLGIATFPVCLIGLFTSDLIESHLRSIYIIAVTTIVFGLLLAAAERYGRATRRLAELTLAGALLIGFAQAIALIPGTSRSGITISAALLLGFTAKDSARFSFLMSIPVIFLGGLLKSYELYEQSAPVDLFSLGLGFLVSAVSAFLCIKYFLAFIEKIGMRPFVWYRIVLGAFLIAFSFVAI